MAKGWNLINKVKKSSVYVIRNARFSDQRLVSPGVVKLTGKSIVVTICKFIIDEHRNSPIFFLQATLNMRNLVLWDLQTGPAVPLKGC